MRFLASLLFLGILLAIPAAAQQKPSNQPTGFFHPQVARDADRYEAYLKSGWTPVGSKKPSDLRASGNRGLGPDPRGASREFANAVVLEPSNAENWLGLARALLAITPDPTHGSERYDLPVNASAAAFRAYEKSASPAAKARSLVILSDALQRRSYWRPAIDALKQSLALAEDQKVREGYDKLRNEHGFRMVDYKTDAEAASPQSLPAVLRAAVAHSVRFLEVRFRRWQGPAERRRRGAPALHRGPDPRPALRDQGSQRLALGRRRDAREGRRHGRLSSRSQTVRPLHRQVLRAAQPRPAGHSRRFRQHQPLAVEVYRIGDRSLASVLQNGELQRQLSSYDAEQLKDRTGTKVYQGEMDVSPKLNEEVTTAFPVTEALGTLKPGVYAMLARPADKSGESRSDLATQWFVVSDLGLTALNGDDGVHAFVRSLIDGDPVSDTEVKLVARNNEVLGLAKIRRGRLRPVPRRPRKGRRRPAAGDPCRGKLRRRYAFLDLTTTAFDLTDRGVKGREPSGPLDAFALHRTRRLSPRREGLSHRAWCAIVRQGAPCRDRHRLASRRRRASSLRAERSGPRRPQSDASARQ